MSFNNGDNQYRYDYFDSAGGIHHSLGNWNASTKTMTSILKDETTGNTTTIVADFSQPDIEQWRIETRDKNNKKTLLVTGKNTRPTKQ